MSQNTYHICLIVEGAEEFAFFSTMNEAGVVSETISLTVVNAGGGGAVVPLFQDYLSYELFDCVLCVYDVDYRQNEPDSPFSKIREGLMKVLAETAIVDSVSFCTNPNFLQIYLLSVKELSEVRLLDTSKTTNTAFVHLCWPDIAKKKTDDRGRDRTKVYDATAWQLRIMNAPLMEGIAKYRLLIRNARGLSKNYLQSICPGSNVIDLIEALLDGDCAFFRAREV